MGFRAAVAIVAFAAVLSGCEGTAALAPVDGNADPSALQTDAISASAARSYRVRAGDTLTAIATTRCTSVSTLKALNGLRNDLILVDQTLRLPEASSADLKFEQLGAAMANGETDEVAALLASRFPGYRIRRAMFEPLGWTLIADAFGDSETTVIIHGACMSMFEDSTATRVNYASIVPSGVQGLKFEDMSAALDETMAAYASAADRH